MKEDDQVPLFDQQEFTVAIQKPYADAAMFRAAPISKAMQVKLLWMTSDPLGAIAAACKMYEGKPTYSLDDITDDERVHYWEQAQATHLRAPLEFVQFHFFIEGIDRSLTHQMVRQRTAVFAQESMRFAVKEELETTSPIGMTESQKEMWEATTKSIHDAYLSLINDGMASEDARGLLPHSTMTRLHYGTNLRSLLDHAGNRLCTQAQFHWRLLFVKIIQAIRDAYPGEMWVSHLVGALHPVCYDIGKCPFQATFDRGCTIRTRADKGEFSMIDPSEWLLDPRAGYTTARNSQE